MKFSLFSITAVLASFVAATPILAPRAASNGFRLIVQGSATAPLQVQYVAEAGYPGYFRFGLLFQPSSPERFLFFPSGRGTPGPVLDVQQNGLELVFQMVPTPPGSPNQVYRALLADPKRIGLLGIETTNSFSEYSGLLDNPAAAQQGWGWYLCRRGAPELELFYSNHVPTDACQSPQPVRLQVQYLGPVVLRVGAAVGQ